MCLSCFRKNQHERQRLQQQTDVAYETKLSRSHSVLFTPSYAAPTMPLTTAPLHSSVHGESLAESTQPDEALRQKTQQAVDVFLFSQQDDGEMGGIGYWQTANAYHAIVLHEMIAGQQRKTFHERILPAMDKIAARVPGFVNEFNDDTLWWAHCLLSIRPLVAPADPSRDGWVVENIHAIWMHVLRFQLPQGRCFLPPSGNEKHPHDMGGAVLWTSKPGEEQVNSITTGLFAALSARLSVLLCPATPQDPERQAAHKYIAAAEAGLSWIFRECYRASDMVVLDGIKIRSGERVNWTFTYTTAATISAIVALSSAYEEILSWNKQGKVREELIRACQLARAAMRREQWVDKETGVLTEPGAYGRGTHDPWQNNDGVGFKSVLVRTLCELRKAIVREVQRHRQHLQQQQQQQEEGEDQFESVRQEIDTFVERQFRSLQDRDTNGNGQYGPWWNGPFEAPTGWSQMAVLDVMAGVHYVGCRL